MLDLLWEHAHPLLKLVTILRRRMFITGHKRESYRLWGEEHVLVGKSVYIFEPTDSKA